MAPDRLDPPTPARGPRILMLSSDYPPEAVGGMGVFAAGLARSLGDAGCSVTVVTTDRSRAVETGCVSVGIMAGPRLTDRSALIWQMFKELQRNVGMAAALPDVDVDVVHFHDFRSAPAAIAIARRLEVPVIMHKETTPRDMLDDRSEEPGWVYSTELENWAIDNCDGIFAVSRNQARGIVHLLGLSGRTSVPPRIHVLTPVSDLVPPERKPCMTGRSRDLLYVGRLAHSKGADLAVRALAADPFRSRRLKLVGRGPDEASLRELTTSLGLQDRVDFLGQVDHSAIGELYRAHTFALVPSRRDPFPLTVLEAQMHGCVVLGAAVDGIVEQILDGQTGVLVPPDDVAALVTAVDELESRPGDIERIGATAWAAAAAQSWERLAHDTIDAYHDVITHHARALRSPRS